MSAGLRTIQSNARSYSNRARREQRLLQKRREAQAQIQAQAEEAQAAGAVPVCLPPPPQLPPPPPTLPPPADFGAAFPSHGPDHPDHAAGRRHAVPPPPFPEPGSQSTANVLPPPHPPFMPGSASRHPFTGSLPPISQVPFGGYAESASRPAGAPPEPPSPLSRTGRHEYPRRDAHTRWPS